MLLLAFQVPVLALPVAAVVGGIGYLDGFWEVYFLAIGAAGIVACYQYFRSHHMPLLAQLVQQSWRIGALATIVVLLLWPGRVALDLAIVTILNLSLGMALGALALFSPKHPAVGRAGDITSIYRIGIRFALTSLCLAMSLYAEQLLVLKAGGDSESAFYFKHATFFLFPMSFFNGYLGFVLGPWVRDNHDLFIRLVCHRWRVALLGIIVFAAIMNGLGQLAWMIVSPTAGPPSVPLMVVFGVCSVAITIYQIPSSYNGIFAKTSHHDLLIAAQILALLAALGCFWWLHEILGLAVTISVAVASLVNWTLRCASGLSVVAIIARGRLAS